MITGEVPELVDAACWYAKALGIEGLDFDLDIVMFSKVEEGNSASGYIDYDGEQFVTIFLAYELEDCEDIMEILAHEMIHAKQYLTGQLKPFILDHVIWEGTVMRIYNDPREWGYWNSPWELEAFGRQQGLNYMRQV